MTIHEQIRSRIESFSRELEALVRDAAIDAVRTSLGGERQPAPAQRVPSASPRPGTPTPSLRATGSLSFKRRKGGKRTPEQLAQIDAALLDYVKANAGQGIEHIAKALGVPSNDLKPRVSLLVDGKELKKTGVKRATKYFAV